MDRRRTVRRLVAALLAAAFVAPVARADQTDPRLDALFSQLRTADRAAASPVEAQIWQIWLGSAQPQVDAAVAEGIAAMNQGDQPTALAAFDRVVKLAPTYAEGWNKRATVLYLMGRYEDSIRDIDRALALEPRHFGALSGLGLCNVQLNRDEAALSAFQRAAAIDPSLSGVQDNIEALKRQIAKEKI